MNEKVVTRKEKRQSLAADGLAPDKAREMLRQMYIIRAFEFMAEQAYAQGKIHGTMHLSIGQEAAAVGSLATLRPDDMILSTHRGHGHCIAKGGDVRRMAAEFFGKETGYCRGRGGSMHIADVEGGNLGANGVVAGGIPLAVGVGLSLKLQKSDRVVLGFFGDGAVNSGPFHESLNMAAIWMLPVVFICENNQYAMSYSVKRAFPIKDLSIRADSYGMPGTTVDGNEVMAVYRAVRDGVERARSGAGPSFVVCETYRWRGHSRSDRNLYRTKEEIEAWKEKDPIPRFRQHLIASGVVTSEDAERFEKEAQAIIDDAVSFAESSPEPSVETIEEGVYAP
jgi:pyruvate dehydrogenase E1 component alpha subunit